MLLPPSTLSQAEPAKLWAAAAHKSSGTRCGSGQLSLRVSPALLFRPNHLLPRISVSDESLLSNEAPSACLPLCLSPFC